MKRYDGGSGQPCGNIFCQAFEKNTWTYNCQCRFDFDRSTCEKKKLFNRLRKHGWCNHFIKEEKNKIKSPSPTDDEL
jgi:hypothetical protein